MKLLKIGTRGSRLALVQTELFCRRLGEAAPEIRYEVIVCKTLGDRRPEMNLMEDSSRGVFCGELEERLIDGEIDLAVHSTKDLPGELMAGLVLAGFLEREDPREVLVSRDGIKLSELATGARIGTSSVRRMVQLRAVRPDLVFLPIRGNVETRIQKVKNGDYDATILALAGIKRLGLEETVSEVFPIDLVMPAPAQGCIGLEIRQDDVGLSELLQSISHPATMLEVRAERGFLRRMGGYCESASGALATLIDDRLHLKGIYAGADGIIHRHSLAGAAEQLEKLGAELAEKLLGSGVDTDV